MIGRALIVVDLQRDFFPGGALPVKHGEQIIEPTNRLISLFEKEGLPILLTRDWHPADHCSFRSQGGPWPPHCIRDTFGAEFHPALHIPKGAVIISKGTRKDKEAYSGFQGTELAGRLKTLGIGDLFVAGLATDYCVKNTVLDAMAYGFKVNVISDCVKGVDAKPTDSANAFRIMLANDAVKKTSDGVINSLGKAERKA